MKGLIYKDLLSLRLVAVSMLVLMLFYLYMGFMSESEAGQTFYFAIMMTVMNGMIPLTCAGFDEQCGWDTFGNALPISRAKVVAARYGTNLIVMLGSAVLVLLSDVLYRCFGGGSSSPVAYLYTLIFSMVYVALLYPIIYRFGVQKSRFVLIALMLALQAIPTVIVGLLAQSRDEGIMIAVETFGEIIETNVLSLPVISVMLIVAAAFYALSLLVSIAIYRRKE